MNQIIIYTFIFLGWIFNLSSSSGSTSSPTIAIGDTKDKNGDWKTFLYIVSSVVGVIIFCCIFCCVCRRYRAGFRDV